MTAFEEIIECLEKKSSFVVEAGAGSGKTYVLIQTLHHLIETEGESLRLHNQSIVCITYTNVAKNEIIKRIEFNDLVNVYTIHEFLWKSIKQFQKQLKIELCKLNETRYQEDVANGKDSKYLENLSNRVDNIESVFYNDSSFRDFENGELHHDDVIELAKMLFEFYPLLTSIVAQKFPYIFVDEYQDTSSDTIQALIDFLLKRNEKRLVLGFYGDSHQKIYDVGVGNLENYYARENILVLIKKEENYRSSKEVVKLLNSFRTNITQHPQAIIDGSIKFIYWKNHPEKGERQKITEFENSLKNDKNNFYDGVINKLREKGWDFKSDNQDKILVLANSRIAERAGFSNLYKLFSKRFGRAVKERLLDRNHILVKLITGYIDKKSSQERPVGIEHLMLYWELDNHNEVIRFIRKNGTILNDFEHSKKKIISDILEDLNINRGSKTIGEVLQIILGNGIISSSSFQEYSNRINQNLDELDDENKDKIEKDKKFYEDFINLPYEEILKFWKHTQNQTVFSTKHGTKGDEYRNVLTVIDDTEWKQEYNFNNFFNDSDNDEKRKLLTRNLFYVECSRAKENLIVLMLSRIDELAYTNIKDWFGEENTIDVESFISS
ncbi:UvrD-helicase domain-containing protein [Chryseobacterium arthrosphaerae]|uniref:ATP-dependent helicase n=1 Tax=Chryseobacterium arthrosphaerae TaxID=651561 RepID=UPI001BB08328|nr:ATP-dependent helicase [Chryseobacterium arthrosphaerae]QUY56569.1 ATP-dependent helicase [Chryseobacterium arthrosphaerae]